MFIHSRTIQVRAVATLMAVPCIWLATILKPISIADAKVSHSIIQWFVFFLFIGMLGVCVYLWRLAPTLEQPPLPDSKNWRGPNRVSVEIRLINLCISAILLGYGTYGLYLNDIFIPSKRGGGVHLTGVAAWLIYVAFMCAIANMIAVVVDHYDKRNNEINYAHFTVASQWLGWMFFILAYVWQIFIR